MLRCVRTGLLPLADWLARSDTLHALYFIIHSIMKGRITTAGDEPAAAEEAELDDWGVTQDGPIQMVAEVVRVEPSPPPKPKYKLLPGQKNYQTTATLEDSEGQPLFCNGMDGATSAALSRIILPYYFDRKPTAGKDDSRHPQQG